MAIETRDTAVRAAVKVAASLGVTTEEPVVLANGANVIVHLSPSPVVAKVAAITPAVRSDPAAWLQRELDVVMFLAAAGAPVMVPSPEMEPIAYQGDGLVMTFWRYCQQSTGAAAPDGAAVGSMLRELHAALRSYPPALPVLAPLDDVPAFLARPETQLDAEQSITLAEACERLTNELRQFGKDGQTLHGDAGIGNLMHTDTGWIWHDFEDTCFGPVAWDLAASTFKYPESRSRILSAYGKPIDSEQLAVCEQLRCLLLTVWYALYAEQRPDLKARAAELMARWI